MKARHIAFVIKLLPKSLGVAISKKVVGRYLDKYVEMTIEGKHVLETMDQPVIFICNHLSNADGLVLDRALKVLDPTFVAGVKLADDPVTAIGLNVIKTTSIVPNSPDKAGLKRVIELVKNGESLLIFPEGTRSRSGQMIQAKKGILLIAKMTKVPLVPIGLHGTEKILPIAKDGDMSREAFCKGSVHVNIGEPFALINKLKGQDKKVYEQEATRHLMGKIAALLPESYRGLYGPEEAHDLKIGG